MHRGKLLIFETHLGGHFFGENKTKLIELTKGMLAKVDDADYEWLSEYSWHCVMGYAARKITINGKLKLIYMHREIMQPEDGQEIDHINRDKCDNQRANLRVCTQAQNNYNRGKQCNNTSGYIGVCFYSDRNKFVARIMIDGRRKYLGCFTDPAEAARVRDMAAIKYYGEFAELNFPPKPQ